MDTTTKQFLRSALHLAIDAENDIAAMELLAILANTTRQQPVMSMPDVQPTVDGPARDYHYWAQFIRDNFIPFLVSNGRIRFTSHELFNWIQNCKELSFTAGDLENQRDGTLVYRGRLSAALGHLKQLGIIFAPVKGRDYQICDQSQSFNERTYFNA